MQTRPRLTLTALVASPALVAAAGPEHLIPISALALAIILVEPAADLAHHGLLLHGMQTLPADQRRLYSRTLTRIRRQHGPAEARGRK